MKKRLIGSVVLALTLLCSFLTTVQPLPAQDSLIGKPAPSFTVTSLDKKTISLDSLKKKVVVLNFWATRCPPCRAEIPEFVQFYRDFEKKGVVIIGLGVRNSDLGGITDREATLQEFSKTNRVNYPIVNDLKNQVARFYGIKWIPTTFVIDRDGIIRDMRVGGIDKQELLKMVEPYLSEVTKE